MTRSIIFVALVASSCARQPPSDPWPDNTPRQLTAVLATAARDCAGRAIIVNELEQNSSYPFVTVRTLTMRCERDGRYVGPYTYTEER